MKIRKDFVTNSSSSSFVVAIKNDKARKPFIMALVNATDSIGETRTGKIISTMDEYEQFIVESWGSYIYFTDENGEKQFRKATLQELIEQEELPDWYDECKDAIQNGFCIISKDIGWSDEGLSDFVDNLAKSDSKNIKLIYED